MVGGKVGLVRIAVVTALLMVLGVLGAGQASAATATVRYGPYTIPATSGTQMGELANRLQTNVRVPCSNCTITSMQANLVSTSGATVNVDEGLLLHHMVLASQSRSDATCGTNFLGVVGERFFASGNERTNVTFPPGYGYQLGGSERWNLIYDLMNMNSQAQTVYIDMTFNYQKTTSRVQPVKPVWLDIDQCGDSEYTVPSGASDTHWDWKVNVPGHIVGTGGHVHTEAHGLRTELTNQTNGQSICTSNATYGGSSEFVDMMGDPWISAMSTCVTDPVATVATGDVVRLHSVYDNPGDPYTGGMGIQLAYIHRH